VQLVGNSFAGEISDCLATILRARGGQLTRLLHIGDALCLYQQDLRRQLKNPNTKPAVAVLFQYPFPNPDSPCSSTKPFAQELSDTISEWRAAGVHVVLVRDIPPVGSSTTTDETADDYRAAARRDPAAVTVADAGVFIRDAAAVRSGGCRALATSSAVGATGPWACAGRVTICTSARTRI
jgi:hypothetical protein